MTEAQHKAAERAVERLDRLPGAYGDDYDVMHSSADRILLEFIGEAGFEEVAGAYDRLVEQARWWAFA